MKQCILKINLFYLAMATLTGCFRDTKVTIDDEEPKISLTVSYNYGIKELSWDTSNISSFKRYVLVRSNIPISLNSLPNSQNTLFESFNIEKTSYRDSTIWNSSSVFYKLYIDAGGRYVESNTVEVKEDVFIMSGRLGFYSFDKDSMRLLLSGTNSSNVAQLFDLKSRTRISTSANLTSSTSSGLIPISAFVLKPAQKFIIFSGSRIIGLTVPGLGEIVNSFEGNAVFHSAVYNNSYLVVTYGLNSIGSKSGQSVYSTNANGVGLLHIHDRNIPGDRRLLSIMSNGRFIEVAAGYAYQYGINIDGKQFSFTTVTTPGIKSLLSRLFVSHDKKQFIASVDGSIYDENLQIIWKRNCPDCNLFAFSEDGNLLYEVSERNTLTGETFIRKYNLITREKITERVIKNSSVSVIDMHAYDGQLGIVYTTSSNSVVFQNITI